MRSLRTLMTALVDEIISINKNVQKFKSRDSQNFLDFGVYTVF